jgi:hypothetical protein
MQRRFLIHATVFTALFAFAGVIGANDFSLDWYTLDGGGGTSSGGGFEVMGTIGQPDAGSPVTPLSGGRFELIGGFWPGLGLVCTTFALVDFDHDCDVDGDDFDTFVSCASGPAVPHSGTAICQAADLDDDNDVDMNDFGVFQRCYSGENNPAKPDCAN